MSSAFATSAARLIWVTVLAVLTSVLESIRPNDEVRSAVSAVLVPRVSRAAELRGVS